MVVKFYKIIWNLARYDDYESGNHSLFDEKFDSNIQFMKMKSILSFNEIEVGLELDLDKWDEDEKKRKVMID